jgi:uncharacterized protein (DUF1800 family)
MPAASWELAHAAHLLNRAGFGGTPETIRELHAKGLAPAVDALIAGFGPQMPPPDWTREPLSESAAGAGKMSRQELAREDRRRILELRSWWLERMRQGRRPLLEKMTLFWHGHFATSYAKVRSASLMWRQNETFRRLALGHFDELLRAMTRDPAMIRWLDLGRSRKGEPNENFAREVMELFTLGQGHYSEQDIKEAARAFTGHRILPATQEFFFARRAHDYGVKTVLGQTGRFDADAVVAILVAQEQCSRFLAQRLAEYFVADEPAPAFVDSLAQVLRTTRYDLTATLRTLFTAREFYAPQVMRSQIKAPIDWLVNACVIFHAPLPRQPVLDQILSRLGQVPFAPPNVRGWEGGKSWISSSTLILRYNLAAALLGNSNARGPGPLRARRYAGANIRQVVPPELRARPDALSEALVFRIFGTPSLPRMRQRALDAIAGYQPPLSDAESRDVCQRLTSTPDFQLT